jgi:hypothetical protein
MEELIITYLKSINIIQVLAEGGLFWIFYNRLLSKMEAGFSKVDVAFSKVDAGFSKVDTGFTGVREEIKELRKDIHSLDKRLCRIEGILHTQDCCAIKSSNEIRKAE